MNNNSKEIKSVVLRIGAFGSDQWKYTRDNKVYMSKKDFAGIGSPDFVRLLTNDERKSYVFSVEASDIVPEGKLFLNKTQRELLTYSLEEEKTVAAFKPDPILRFTTYLRIEIGFFGKKTQVELDAEEIRNEFKKVFNGQVLTQDQLILFVYKRIFFQVRIVEIQLVGSKGELIENADRGILHEKINTIDVTKQGGDGGLLTINGGMSQGTLFTKNFNPEGMGVGGLDREFTDILRRAFMSRMFPIDTIKKLGIKHVKGMLLYGPPGCGKTLMARQIGKMVSSVEPKLVEGPSILNKYVGESEANIRNLFADAEAEQNARGDESQLHIIILDELDAICKQRGSRNDSTGVGDTVVNQLLSKIDGVNSLNNILVIGMTNRKDMIDDALLRPGRLEIQIEIGLPDEAGRVQILHIHTKKMRENKMLDPSVKLEDLAKVTKNFSGAEIEGLVISATSFAMKEKFDIEKCKPKDTQITVTREHFDMALSEMKPAFGVDNDDHIPLLPEPMLVYSNKQQEVRETLKDSFEDLLTSQLKNKTCMLIGGRHGSGKTAVAVEAAKQSGFPYIKILDAENLIGFSEATKCSRISRIFTDAHKSPQSVVIIHKLERILEYTPIGPRFDNTTLNLLLAYIGKPVPRGKKLYVICTTSLSPDVLELLGIWDAFSERIHLPAIENYTQFELLAKGSGIYKKLTEENWADIGLKFVGKTITISNALSLLESLRNGYHPQKFERKLEGYQELSADPWESFMK